MWAETWQDVRNGLLWVIEVIRGCGPKIQAVWGRHPRTEPHAPGAHVSNKIVVGVDPAGGHGEGVVAYRRAHDGLVTKITGTGYGRCPFCPTADPDMFSHVRENHPERAVEWMRGHASLADDMRPEPPGIMQTMGRRTPGEFSADLRRMANRASEVIDGMRNLGPVVSEAMGQAVRLAAEEEARRARLDARTRELYEGGYMREMDVRAEMWGVQDDTQDGSFTAAMVRREMARIRDQYLDRDLGHMPDEVRAMIQSSERPSNEILLCGECGHTYHSSGDPLCTVMDRDGGPMCGCVGLCLGCGHGFHRGMPCVEECERVDGMGTSTCPCGPYETIASPVLIALCGLCGHPDHSDHPETECGHAAGSMGAPCTCLYIEIDAPVPMEDLAGPDDGNWRVIREGDPAYNDLQTYLEGGTLESTDAAKLLDQRGVDYGQVSPKTFWDAWGELPRSTYQSHKIWCARPGEHPHQDCPVWGAE